MKTAELAAADAAFGADLYQRLAGRSMPGNLVFSPASVAIALRMALIGARGETAAELARALHLPGSEAARDAQLQYASLLASPDLTLSVVNTAWLDLSLRVRKEFLDQPVTVQRVDFAGQPGPARAAINEAVDQQTAGKITDLIPPGLIDEDTRLVLVNAIYLKARWQHEFTPQQTRKEPFYPEHTGPSQADMMHQQAALGYARGDGYQAVLLPYRHGPLAMAIVLPDGPLSHFPLDGPGGAGEALRQLLAGPERCQVDLRLPKFRIEVASRLGETLRQLGVVRAFSGNADFSGIAEEPLAISEVVHKAFIDVDEEGTEAAAATAVVMLRAAVSVRPPAKRVVFTADRPFLFAVVETRSGLPLFLGQVTRPLGPVPLLACVNRLSGMSRSSGAGRPGCRPRTRRPAPGRGLSSWSGPSIPGTRPAAAA
jgi:serpin B